MTKREAILNGYPFEMNGDKFVLSLTDDNGYCLTTDYGWYAGNVDRLGPKFIKFFTYALGKKITAKINFRSVKLVEPSKN